MAREVRCSVGKHYESEQRPSREILTELNVMIWTMLRMSINLIVKIFQCTWMDEYLNLSLTQNMLFLFAIKMEISQLEHY